MISVYYYIVFVLITAICFVVMGLLFILTALFDRNRIVMHKFSYVWSWLIFAAHPGWKRKLIGLDSIKKDQAYVIVTNHQSTFDIPNMYILPLNFKWVSKKEVYDMPVYGWVLRMHRDIGIKRMSAGGAKKFLTEGTMWLDKGISVIMFPEGTRSKTGEIGRFKEGAFLLAKSAGVAILPVVADGTARVSKGWKVSRRNTFTIKVLPAIDAGTVQNTDIKQLTLNVHDIMVAAHQQIVEDNR